MPKRKGIDPTRIEIEEDIDYDDSLDVGIPVLGGSGSSKTKKRSSPRQILKDIITFRLRKNDVVRIYRNREKGLYDYIKDNFDEIRKQYKSIRIDLSITKNYVEIRRRKKKLKIKVISPDFLEDLGSEKPLKRYERDIDIKVNTNISREIDTSKFILGKDTIYNINKEKNLKDLDVKVSPNINIEVLNKDRYVFTTFFIGKEDLNKVIVNKDYLFKIIQGKKKDIQIRVSKEVLQDISYSLSIYSVIVSKTGRVHITFQTQPNLKVNTANTVHIDVSRTDRVILPNVDVSKDIVMDIKQIKQLFKNISITVNRHIGIKRLEIKKVLREISLKLTKPIQLSKRGIENINVNINKITGIKTFLSARGIKKLNIFLNVNKDILVKIFKEKPKPQMNIIEQKERKIEERKIEKQQEEKGIIANLKKLFKKFFR